MRTTRKAFKEQVQQHIIEALHEDAETTKEGLQVVVDSFNNYYQGYEQKRNPNKYTAFQEWMLGLPSEFNIEFTHYGIYKTLKAWFENCDAEYQEQDSDKESELYFHLVTREFRELCDKHEINF